MNKTLIIFLPLMALMQGCYYAYEISSEDQKAAGQGEAEAQFKLGAAYSGGRPSSVSQATRKMLGVTRANVTQDYAEAAKWYQKAADQGHAKAQYNLGLMYANGQGVTQNYTEAVKWYRKAAEQGDARAQNNLGFAYSAGQGVAKDEAEAVKWFQKAAEQGHQFAQTNLGSMYEKGQGVAKDEAEAVKWYRKAAEQGDKVAIKELQRLLGKQ